MVSPLRGSRDNSSPHATLLTPALCLRLAFFTLSPWNVDKENRLFNNPYLIYSAGTFIANAYSEGAPAAVKRGPNLVAPD